MTKLVRTSFNFTKLTLLAITILFSISTIACSSQKNTNVKKQPTASVEEQITKAEKAIDTMAEKTNNVAETIKELDSKLSDLKTAGANMINPTKPNETANNLAAFIHRSEYKEGENIVFSPLSIAIALGMVANGADGQTAKNFNLLLGGETEAVNKYYKTLIAEYANNKVSEIHIANKAYFNMPINKTSTFYKSTTSTYGVAPEQLDFSKKKSVEQINKWVKDQTNQMIDGIVEELNNDDKLLIINTIYLKSKWQQPFDKYETASMEFTNRSGDKIKTDFMQDTKVYKVYEDDKLDAVILPYNDNHLEMVFILPKEKSDVYITSLLFAKVANSDTNKLTHLAIPKFTAEENLELIEALSNTAIADAFDAKLANFKNIDKDGGLFISDIAHKAKVIVDEDGTEAAAATGVTVSLTSIRIPEKELIFNKPFHFFIWDKNNQIPLFVGSIEKL